MLHLVGSGSDHPSDTPAFVDKSHPAAVHRYEILDTPPEAAFDRITALAADLFDAPISIIGLRDRDRLWFKSHHGLDVTELSWGRDASTSTMELRLRREFNLGFFVGAPLQTSDGDDLGSLCVMDRQARQVDERQIRHLKALADIVVDHLELRLTRIRAAAGAALAAREVDHRAMNSLQFVASLLNLQSRFVTAEAAGQLEAAEHRVLAVARVHRSFAVDKTADRVDMPAYLRQLCGELSTILGTKITVAGSAATGVPAMQVLPIGVIVNELVTNAKKHGAGPITVTFGSGAAGQYELCVLDEGAELPAGFTVDRSGSRGIGMKVVAGLVEQLAGRLSTYGNPAGRGTCVSVSFPAATH